MATDQPRSFIYDHWRREIHDGWASDRPEWFEANLVRAVERGDISEAERQELLAELASWEAMLRTMLDHELGSST